MTPHASVRTTITCPAHLPFSLAQSSPPPARKSCRAAPAHDLDLQVQLRPVGVLELSLVEKIAVTLWRQRRLVGAETASIELELTSRRVANEVTVAMGLSGYGGEKIEPSDLQPLAQNQLDQLRWCKSLVEQHGQASAVTLDNLREAAPLIYAQLTKDAKGDSEAIS